MAGYVTITSAGWTKEIAVGPSIVQVLDDKAAQCLGYMVVYRGPVMPTPRGWCLLVGLARI